MSATGGSHAERPHQSVARTVHENQYRAKDSPKCEQWTRTDQCHASGKIESEGFGGEFTRDHVDEGDRGEPQCQRHSVDCQSGPQTDRSEQGLDDTRQRGFADPPQSETGERNPELSGRDRVILVLDRLLGGFRAAAALGDPEFDLRPANRDEGEFGGDEIGIDGDENDNSEQTEDRESQTWTIHSSSTGAENQYRGFMTPWLARRSLPARRDRR